MTLQEQLLDPELFTTSAMAILMDKFGSEFMSWDPATLALEIQSGFGIEPSPTLLDRCNAGITLFSSNLFFVSVETFSPLCDILNFGVLLEGIGSPAELDDVMWGCTEARLLLGPLYRDADFGHGPRRYVGALLTEHGIRPAPRILSFAEYPDDGTIPDSDMPEQEFMEMMQRRESSAADLEKENARRLTRLMHQLASLPLKSTDPEFIKALQAQLDPAS